MWLRKFTALAAAVTLAGALTLSTAAADAQHRGFGGGGHGFGGRGFGGGHGFGGRGFWRARLRRSWLWRSRMGSRRLGLWRLGRLFRQSLLALVVWPLGLGVLIERR